MISKFNKDSEFYTPERCYITEMHNNDTDKDSSVARARVMPGVTTQLHALKDTDERYVILSGEGFVEVGSDFSANVGPLDVVYIPKDVSQRITNTSKDTDLIFICVCSPRFQVNSYIDLETQV